MHRPLVAAFVIVNCFKRCPGVATETPSAGGNKRAASFPLTSYENPTLRRPTSQNSGPCVDRANSVPEDGRQNGTPSSRRLSQASQTRVASPSEFECGLRPQQIRRYLDPTSRIWTIDEAALAEIENDVQALVNCTRSGDVLLFDVESVNLTSTVILPWSLSLSAYVDETNPRDGVFPSSREPTSFRCPGPGRGAFSVKYVASSWPEAKLCHSSSPDVLFANVVFEECVIRNAVFSKAIVEIHACGEANPLTPGTVRFHHVRFEKNVIEQTVVLSTEPDACSTIEMLHIAFVDNTCLFGPCGAVLRTNSTLRDIVMRRNRPATRRTDEASVIEIREGAAVKAVDLFATENEMTAIHLEGSSLVGSDWNCRNNTIDAISNSRPLSACVQIIHSAVSLSTSSFESNRAAHGAALLGTNSTINLTNVDFVSNSASGTGGALLLSSGTVAELEACSFTGNNATLSGGLARLDHSRIHMNNSDVQGSLAESGGCFYLANNSQMILRSSNIQESEASRGGLAALHGGSIAEVHDSLISVCKANFSGGAFHLSASNLTLLGSEFSNCNASWNGGFAFLADASSAHIEASVVAQSSASWGGALSLENQSSVRLDSVNMEGSSAGQYTGDGGAIHAAEGCEVNATGFRCVGSTAANGGCVYAERSRIFFNASDLRGNSANASGGAVMLSSGSTLVAERTAFSRNTAKAAGGALHVIGSDAIIDNCNASLDTAETGGFLHASDAEIDLYSTTIQNATARAGGGGCLSAIRTNLTLDRVIVDACSASEEGGGLALKEASVGIMTHCSVLSCRSNGNGGGVFASDSVLSVVDARIWENTAAGDGGGLFVESMTDFRISKTVLESNSATSGGALVMEFVRSGHTEDSHFRDNTASRQGGAAHVRYCSPVNCNVTFSSCSFQSDMAVAGGSMSLQSAAGRLQNLTFRGGNATLGGCLHATEASTLNISDTVFIGCTASKRGGGLLLNDSSAVDVTFSNFTNCSAGTGAGISAERGTTLLLRSGTFADNEADHAGGAVSVEGNSSANISNTQVKGNGAKRGGALWVSNFSNLTLQFSNLSHNTASERGGAVCVKLRSNATLHDTNVTNNSALGNGGAAFLDGAHLQAELCQWTGNEARADGGSVFQTRSMVHISRCNFTNGSADGEGGYIYANALSEVKLAEVSMTGGHAVHGGAMSLRNSTLQAEHLSITSCRAKGLAGGAMLRDMWSSSCTDCNIQTSSAGKKGGALHIEVTAPRPAEIVFTRSSFDSNTAARGGAIHVEGHRAKLSCTDAPDICQILVLVHCSISRNEAPIAGSAILAFETTAVRYVCHLSSPHTTFQTRAALRKLPALGPHSTPCPEWRDNTNDSTHHAVGGYARVLQKTMIDSKTDKEKVVTGDTYIVPNHAPGAALPVLRLDLSDQMHQLTDVGLNVDKMTARMRSDDGFFPGELTVLMAHGTGNFSGVVGFHPPGDFRINVSFSEPYIDPFFIEVKIRGCHIGEAAAANGHFCRPCGGSTYSFEPNKEHSECQTCPAGGRCNSSTIQPVNGYWHAFPCSSHMQECLSESSCDFDGRSEKLYELVKDQTTCDMSDESITRYREEQCKEGYTGPLCGVCEDDYGKLQNYLCEKCFGSVVIVVLVIASFGFFLLASGLATRANIRASVPQSGAESNENQTNGRAATQPQNGQAVNEAQASQDGQAGGEEESRQHIESVAHLRIKSVESFKVLLNYVQVTAMVGSVRVNWRKEAKVLFIVADYIGGKLTEAMSLSVSCLLSKDAWFSQPVVGFYADLGFYGLALLLHLAVHLFICFGTAGQQQGERPVWRLILRGFHSAVIIWYIAYSSLSALFLSTFSCIDVHDSTKLGDPTEKTLWAEDTSVECYTGGHLHLFVASVVGLIVFSIFLPLFLLFLIGLPASYSQNDGALSRVEEVLGFMYRSYRKEGYFCLWEGLIFLRKAGLAAVMAFAYQLGANLQVLLAVCLLLIATFLHIAGQPFHKKSEDVGQLETYSLMASTLAFVSSLFFADEKIPEYGRLAATIGFIVFNVAVFLWFSRNFLAIFWRLCFSRNFLRSFGGAHGMPLTQLAPIVESHQVRHRLQEDVNN